MICRTVIDIPTSTIPPRNLAFTDRIFDAVPADGDVPILSPVWKPGVGS